ncbi:MAG: Trm112 family protein [Rhodospirillales bacterium]
MAAPSRTVDPKLLEILVCPLTKGPLRYDADAQELISDRAGLAFPIREGVPIMLPDEAREIDPDSEKGPRRPKLVED